MTVNNVSVPMSLNTSVPTLAYDDIIYDSKPFPQTNPILLQGTARLFGLNAPSPYKARILEIGCATGANIRAIASLYPDSQCVGIDYSEPQIVTGKKTLQEQGIKNLVLKHMSVTDINSDFGTFDYIICHGVMSWVPKEVQDKIFEVCKTNLSDNGIAYISYNTAPGWNVMGAIRDLFVYHTAPYEEPMVKAREARQILKLLAEASRISQNPMAGVVDGELKRLEKLPDYYIVHEFLTETNIAFYFHEFVEKARKQGLQYLADTEIELMFSGNLPPEIVAIIPENNDLIRTQQYMDYVYNRRFRNTLLCHENQKLNLQVPAELLSNGWLLPKLEYPDGFLNHNIHSGQVLHFKSTLSQLTISSGESLLLAIFQVFAEQPYQPMRIEDITKKLLQRFTQNQQRTVDATKLQQAICIHVLRYVFTRGILFFSEPPPFISQVSKKPAISALAVYQAQHQDWVTSQLLEDFIEIPLFDRILMRYTDGSRTANDLVKAMLSHFTSGEIELKKDNTISQEELKAQVSHSLQHFANIGILVK